MYQSFTSNHIFMSRAFIRFHEEVELQDRRCCFKDFDTLFAVIYF